MRTGRVDAGSQRVSLRLLLIGPRVTGACACACHSATAVGTSRCGPRLVVTAAGVHASRFGEDVCPV